MYIHHNFMTLENVELLNAMSLKLMMKLYSKLSAKIADAILYTNLIYILPNT